MQTTRLFENSPYLKTCNAKIVDIDDHILLDQTVFYPTGGGQPGDQGYLIVNDQKIEIINTQKHKLNREQIAHIVAEQVSLDDLKIGMPVDAYINWELRYAHMRMHSALHLLCAILPYGVSGCQIGATKSRMDFNYPKDKPSLDKAQIEEQLNALIARDFALSAYWIDEKHLDENPDMVRTMSVTPPRGTGKIRILEVGDKIDIQPCGGTHIQQTGEIGKIKILKIENKGQSNRRISIAFA
ncbi:MAG: alanyl-tRNA editing protein [Pseudomonadota bacterium]